MRLINNSAIHEYDIHDYDSDVIDETPPTLPTDKCYCTKCKKSSAPPPDDDDDSCCSIDDKSKLLPIQNKTIEVHPIVIRKTPKFPSRERHKAIRRKKSFHTGGSDAVDGKHMMYNNMGCKFVGNE